MSLRNAVAKLAAEKPELRKYLVPILRKTAMEFDTEDALKKYLDEHPGADKTKHTVKKDDGGKNPEEKSEKKEPEEKEPDEGIPPPGKLPKKIMDSIDDEVHEMEPSEFIEGGYVKEEDLYPDGEDGDMDTGVLEDIQQEYIKENWNELVKKHRKKVEDEED